RDRKAWPTPIGEKVERRLRPHFHLSHHVWKQLGRRVGAFLSAEPKDGDDRYSAQQKNEKEAAQHISIVVDDSDMLAAGLFQQLARFSFSKARIARLDNEKEAVIGSATEAFPIENWMMRTRQTIHDENGEK